MPITRLLGSALLLLVSLQALADAKDDLKVKLEGINELRADFTQEIRSSEGELLAAPSGFLQIKKPSQVLLFTKDPEETILFSRGREICYYDPFVNQVTVMDDDILLTTPFALLISGSAEVWDRYEVSGGPDDYTLTVRDPQELKSLRVVFDGDELESIVLNMQDGTVNSYTLSNVSDQAVDEDFNVQIPKDAEIDYAGRK